MPLLFKEKVSPSRGQRMSTSAVAESLAARARGRSAQRVKSRIATYATDGLERWRSVGSKLPEILDFHVTGP